MSNRSGKVKRLSRSKCSWLACRAWERLRQGQYSRRGLELLDQLTLNHKKDKMRDNPQVSTVAHWPFCRPRIVSSALTCLPSPVNMHTDSERFRGTARKKFKMHGLNDTAWAYNISCTGMCDLVTTYCCEYHCRMWQLHPYIFCFVGFWFQLNSDV